MSFPFKFEGISNQKDIVILKKYLDCNENAWGEVDNKDYWKGRTLFFEEIIPQNIKILKTGKLASISLSILVFI